MQGQSVRVRAGMASRAVFLSALALAAVLVAAPVGGAHSVASKSWIQPGQSPDRRADALVAQMTLDEKISLLHGADKPGYIGYVPGIPRLGIPPQALTDGPAGVRQGTSTQMPAPIALAATFDTAAAALYGDVLGRDTVAKGQNVLLAPNVNLARVPQNGRTFEGFGEDPFLAGEIAVQEIRAIQRHPVITTVKHFAGNNQETNRTTVNSVVDERTLQEIELPAFRAAVKRGRSGGVMCAYNKLNGPWTCESRPLLTDVLKRQWRFPGYVVSDWGSTHSTAGSANAGLDQEMPSGVFFAGALKAAVQSGQVPMARLNDMVHRVLRSMFAAGLFEHPLQVGTLPVAADAAAARQVGTDAAVLLKNSGRQLPLDANRVRSLAVIGADADNSTTGGGSSRVLPVDADTPLEAIRARVPHARVEFARGNDPVSPGSLNPGLQPVPSAALTPSSEAGARGLTGTYYPNATFSGTPNIVRTDPGVYFSWHWYDLPNFAASSAPPMPPSPNNPQPLSVRWTGTFTAPSSGDYAFDIATTDRATVYWDGHVLIDARGTTDQAPVVKTATVHLAAGQTHEVRIDYVGAIDFATQTGTRIKFGWRPPAGAVDANIAAAARLARRADVAVVLARDYETEALDRPDLSLPNSQDALISAVAAANPRTVVVLETGAPVLMPWLDKVPAVLEAWYPGERGGSVVSSLLFGDANPGGRLPMTFPRSEAQLPANTPQQFPGVDLTASYSERLRVGYRHFDATGQNPLFAFGDGLSYTTFRQRLVGGGGDRAGHVGAVVAVTNTGRRRGSEVVQGYVAFPARHGEPPKQLKAIGKITLAPGQRGLVGLRFAPRAFAHWSTASHSWVIGGGTYRILVGSSSRDIYGQLAVHLRRRDLGP